MIILHRIVQIIFNKSQIYKYIFYDFRAIKAIFERVRQTADYMPQKQLIQQMDTHLPGWREKFADFDLEPFAAASIGQGNG